MRCWVDDVNIASHIGSAVLLIFFRIILCRKLDRRRRKCEARNFYQFQQELSFCTPRKYFMHSEKSSSFSRASVACMSKKIQHTKIGSNAKARKIDFCCFCHSAHCVRLLPYLNVSSRDMFKAHATCRHGVCTTLSNNKLILTFSTSMAWRRWKSLKKCKKEK